MLALLIMLESLAGSKLQKCLTHIKITVCFSIKLGYFQLSINYNGSPKSINICFQTLKLLEFAYACVWEDKYMQSILENVIHCSFNIITMDKNWGHFQYFLLLKILLEFHRAMHTYTYTDNLVILCKDKEFGSDFVLDLCTTFTFDYKYTVIINFLTKYK